MSKRQKIVNKAAYQNLKKLQAVQPRKTTVRDRERALKDVEAYLKKISYSESEVVDLNPSFTINDSTSNRVTQEKVLREGFHKIITQTAIIGGDRIDAGREIYKLSGKRYDLQLIGDLMSEIKKSEGFDEKKTTYLNSLDDVPIYRKRYRLESYQEIFKEAQFQFRHSPSKQNMEILLKILAQVKKEAEESKNTVNFYQQNNNILIQNIIESEEVKEILGTLPLQDIIMGKVASRVGLHPFLLVQRLNSSIYNKFNGSENSTLQSIKGTPDYPSTLILSSEEIERKHGDFLKKEEEVQRKIDIIEDNKLENDNIDKAGLLDRIRYMKLRAKEEETGIVQESAEKTKNNKSSTKK